MSLLQILVPEKPEPALLIEDEMVPLEIRINRRARRYILRVDPMSGAVTLITPSKRALKDAIGFAEGQRAWIAARRRECPRPVPFAAGSILPLEGVAYLIAAAENRPGAVWRESGDPPRLCVTGDVAHHNRRISSYLKEEARRRLRQRTDDYCNRLGLERPRLVIRDPATRWGSCSRRSGLSFSWRLILAPPNVLDYVSAHEVAHLVHMNHSKRFWSLVDELHGDADAAIAWLRREGRGLHRYGRGQPPPEPTKISSTRSRISPTASSMI